MEVADHQVRVLAGERMALLSTAAPCPPGGTAAELEEVARQLYLSLLERAADLAAPHLVRVWNFIPGILNPLSDLPHSYMAFNAGRFRAYRRWFGREFPLWMPTASGVGNPHDRLVIHALSADRQALPVDNPRQFPSHRYSARYGPYPPCFARAVDLELPDGRRWLLAGGTASVRGERTVHGAELDEQIRETFLNLAALVEAAARPRIDRHDLSREEIASRLDRYRFLRVYLPDPSTAERIGERVSASFPRAQEIELSRTELCRPDLLVEIEGAAELDPVSNGG